jgi:hypothetical protein
MSFYKWLESNQGQPIIDKSSADKDAAVNALIADHVMAPIALKGFQDYMLADGHLARAHSFDDQSCGFELKSCLYSCFESEIEDAIEAHSKYKIGVHYGRCDCFDLALLGKD